MDPNALLYFLFIAELQSLLSDFHQRQIALEGDKWDLDHAIKMRDYQVKKMRPWCIPLNKSPALCALEWAHMWLFFKKESFFP